MLTELVQLTPIAEQPGLHVCDLQIPSGDIDSDSDTWLSIGKMVAVQSSSEICSMVIILNSTFLAEFPEASRSVEAFQTVAREISSNVAIWEYWSRKAVLEDTSQCLVIGESAEQQIQLEYNPATHSFDISPRGLK